MGEVYRAGSSFRPVAIKACLIILPPMPTHRRFEQEAQAVAALSHQTFLHS
jgi:hypothetical protein